MYILYIINMESVYDSEREGVNIIHLRLQVCSYDINYTHEYITSPV